MSQLEAVLSNVPPLPADMAARVRAQLMHEAGTGPRQAPSWRRDLVLNWFCAIVLVLMLALFLGVAGQLDVEALAHRWPGFSLLLLSTGFCAWAALVPRRRWARWAAVGVAASAASMVVVLRIGHGQLSALPEWVCSVSHLAAALPPVAVAALSLRRLAPSPGRAITLGLGMGTVGALMGEFACSQSAGHVVRFHLTVWVLVAIVVRVVSSQLKRSSYAP